jgi:hypothetical protein
MKYTPYTEAQIISMNMMEEGIYPFEVLEATTTDKFNNPMVDRNGNDMAKLKLCVWDNENKERILITYMSGDGAFAYKLRHFAQTLGMIQDYEGGFFNVHNTIGKSGKANIIVKKGTMKNDGSGEMWADRNEVKDFVVSTEPVTIQPPVLSVPPTQDLDDEIPF